MSAGARLFLRGTAQSVDQKGLFQAKANAEGTCKIAKLLGILGGVTNEVSYRSLKQPLHTTMKKTALTFALGACLLVSARAAIISVDFTGDDNNIAGGYPPWGAPTTPMAGTEIAGVVAAGNWNSYNQNVQASAMFVADSTGEQSGISMTWSAPFGAQTTINDIPGDYRMMRGGLWTSGEAISVTITIPVETAAQGYQLYAYGDTNSTVIPNVARQFGMSVTADGVDAFGNKFLYDGQNTDFSGQYLASDGSQSWPSVQNQSNYFAFDTLYATQVTLYVFNFQASDDASYWAQLSGLQIVTVPEPSTVGLGLLSVICIGFRPIRRMARSLRASR